MGIKGTDSTILIQLLNQKYLTIFLAVWLRLTRKQSAIVESLPEIKKMIYKDKLLVCESDILMLALSKILALGLTGNVKAYSPLFNKLSKKMSGPLSSITEIDYVDLLTNSLNSSSNNLEPLSWSWTKINTSQTLTKNSQMTYSPLYKFSHVKKWDVEDTNLQEMHLRVRKFRLQPTKEVKMKAIAYMNTCRWTVNQGIEYFNRTGKANAMHLRDEFVSKQSRYDTIIPSWLFDQRPKWIFETPKVYRYNILRKLESNVKSAFSNLKAKNIKYFKFRYRSKHKNNITHLEADKNTCSICEIGNHIYLNMPGLDKIRIIIPRCDRKKKVLPRLIGGVTIRMENNSWYADIYYEARSPEIKDLKRICALDPGQRSFLSGIDLQGNTFQLGVDVQRTLLKMKLKRNIAQSNYIQLKSQNNRSYKEYKMFVRAKRAFYLTTNKIKNYIKQLHYHSVKYLTDHYDKIIIPEYQSQRMVQKGKNKFNDMMLSLNHFSFRELLIAKCKVLHKRVIVCTEEYTSATCGKCNGYKLDLGSNKIYKCNSCDYIADRDENAAFNILRFVVANSLSIKKIM